MPRVFILPDDRTFEANPGETILDASLRAGIAHSHVCGGLGRCSTCRVLILEGLECCETPNAKEDLIARKLRFAPAIRLACQIKVSGDVKLRRLVLDEDDRPLTSLLGEGATSGRVGDEKKIAILFADIRGFTPFAEALPAYDVIHVLNRYFRLMGGVIHRHGGYVDNYMGDGLMALFGVEDPRVEDPRVVDPDQAPLRSIRAGLEMLEASARFQPYLEELYHRSFQIRVGVHYGEVVVGAIGAAGHERVTAIGDAVNLASRIEAANKKAGTQFLISQDTWLHVREAVRVGRSIHVNLAGKSGAYNLYEILGITAQDRPREG